MRPANERFTIPEHEQGEAAAPRHEGVLHTGNSWVTEPVAITVGEQP